MWNNVNKIFKPLFDKYDVLIFLKNYFYLDDELLHILIFYEIIKRKKINYLFILPPLSSPYLEKFLQIPNYNQYYSKFLLSKHNYEAAANEILKIYKISQEKDNKSSNDLLYLAKNVALVGADPDLIYKINQKIDDSD